MDKLEYLVVSRKSCPACSHIVPNMVQVAKNKSKTLHVIESSTKELYRQAVHELQIKRVPSLFRINYTKETVEEMSTGANLATFIQ